MLRRLLFFILLFLGICFVVVLYFYGYAGDIVQAKGPIGMKQRDLLFAATYIMFVIVVPVTLLALAIAWKYREKNKHAKYAPDWDFNLLAEVIWWGFPCVIVTILSVITWKSCHELDPYKPLISDKKPLTIQVVALQWKWLFIYPEQEIASVNFFQIPKETPIDFSITADAPMNSFWVPQLGGQIYAMPGMRTELHLMADEEGSFKGASANLSGRGFAGMTFIAKASSDDDFQTWVQNVKSAPSPLTLDEYNKLREPSENNPVASYPLSEKGLFDWIIMTYMMPMEHHH